MMRCRIPPLSSCGYIPSRSDGTRTSARTFRARSSASFFSTVGSWARIVSMKWSRIRMSGSNRVIGSWKIIARFRPRRSRTSLGGKASRSRPAKRIDPCTLALRGWSRRIARPRVLFPHPLSPTSPTVLPLSIVKSTSCTAWTFPCGVSNVTDRCLTSRSALTPPPPPLAPSCGGADSGCH